jgi:hypothetical protein
MSLIFYISVFIAGFLLGWYFAVRSVRTTLKDMELDRERLGRDREKLHLAREELANEFIKKL